MYRLYYKLFLINYSVFVLVFPLISPDYEQTPLRTQHPHFVGVLVLEFIEGLWSSSTPLDSQLAHQELTFDLASPNSQRRDHKAELQLLV